jgi:PAS domain S-box-containing protein
MSPKYFAKHGTNSAMWPFNKNRAREEERNRKVMAGQQALLDAAISTADIAENVTTKLKNYLTDSIKQFEATIRILTDALIVCDDRGFMQAFNPSAETIFSCSADSILKTNIMHLMMVDGKEPTDIEKFWGSAANDTDNIRGHRLNGETFPLDMSMVRLARSDGKIVVLVLVRDLTEENDIQRRVEIHEYRYNAIFDFVSDGILIVQQNKIVASNLAAGKLFQKDDLLYSRFDSLVDPVHRQAVQKIDSATGEIEAIATRGDGSVLPLIFSSTSFSWNDSPASLITIKDISQLKSFDYAIRQHRSNCVDMIVCFDADFKISYANEPYCSYYNKTKADVMGTDVRMLMPEGERNVVMMNLQSLTEAAPEKRLQVNTKTADGIRLQDWVDRATFQNGVVIEYQRVGRDITDIFKMV